MRKNRNIRKALQFNFRVMNLRKEENGGKMYEIDKNRSGLCAERVRIIPMKDKNYRRKMSNGSKRFAALFLLTFLVIVCGRNVQAAGRPVSISSCQIAGGNVNCTLTASSVPSSDDG